MASRINQMNNPTILPSQPALNTNLNSNALNPNAALNSNTTLNSGISAGLNNTNQSSQQLYQFALNLIVADKREAALLELSKKREAVPDLAPILWHSVGTISALIQEIISIYPLLNTPAALTPTASNRCCNALALLFVFIFINVFILGNVLHLMRIQDHYF